MDFCIVKFFKGKHVLLFFYPTKIDIIYYMGYIVVCATNMHENKKQWINLFTQKLNNFHFKKKSKGNLKSKLPINE
jgi:hypothetical protein